MTDFLTQQLKANLRGDFAEGQRICDLLEKERPDCPRVAFNRGWQRLHDGKFQEGLKLLDRGREIDVFGSKPLASGMPQWDGKADLRGKHVLLVGEGGLGDEIANARFTRNLSDTGARVTLAASHGLMSLLARGVGVSAVADRKQGCVYHDYWVPAMSAARWTRAQPKSLYSKPYLFAHPEMVKKWSPLKGKIGIRCWGNPDFDHQQFRKFPVNLMWDAVAGRETADLQLESTTLPIQSWEDTAGILANLKLVITSCTAVAHLAGAMGVPTWVVVPILPYYTWALPGEKSPWYDTVTLFRQEKFGCWKAPFAEIKKRLEGGEV